MKGRIISKKNKNKLFLYTPFFFALFFSIFYDHTKHKIKLLEQPNTKIYTNNNNNIFFIIIMKAC